MQSTAEITEARRAATRVTLIGMVLDLLLSLAKVVGGLLTQSFALVTDGIHSLTDAITDVFVLLVARVANREPDAEHPYGHGRFETLGTVGMGMVFFATAGILLYDSLQRLRSIDELAVPAVSGVAIALVSIGTKEWIFHYSMGVARRLNSSLLRANAWHSRSDAMSSVAVLIGLLAAQQGLAWMDIVAAIFVALLIARLGWEMCADSLRELVDTAIPAARQQQLRECVLSVAGIRGITDLRSRLSGGKIILEVHLLVNPRITVSEGHQLGENVRRALLTRFSDVGEVIVHIDSESHNQAEIEEDARQELPDREEILAVINANWRHLQDELNIDRILLHYLEHGVEVDLIVRQGELSEALLVRLTQALAGLDYLAGLRVYHLLSESRLVFPQYSLTSSNSRDA